MNKKLQEIPRNLKKFHVTIAKNYRSDAECCVNYRENA